jgi:Protein of unknown function (DUF1084)
MRLTEAFDQHVAALHSSYDAVLAAMPDWWERIDEDPDWQRYSEYGLAGGYALIAVVALVQLVRIQLRVPEYGWTTQKVRGLPLPHASRASCYVLETG